MFKGEQLVTDEMVDAALQVETDALGYPGAGKITSELVKLTRRMIGAAMVLSPIIADQVWCEKTHEVEWTHGGMGEPSHHPDGDCEGPHRTLILGDETS